LIETRLEEALSSATSPLMVDLEATDLTWSGWNEPIRVRARDTRILDERDEVLATLAHISVWLSRASLFRGKLDPVALELVDVHAEITRAADGTFEIGIAETADSTDDRPGPRALSIAKEWLEPSSTDHPLSRLSRIILTGARLKVQDRMLGLSWGADNVDLALERDARRLRVELALNPNVAGEMARLRIDSEYTFADRILRSRMEFEALPLSRFAPIDPRLAPLESFDRPLEGWLEVSLHHWTEFREASCDLKGEAGHFSGRIARTGDDATLEGELDVRGLAPWLLARTMPELRHLQGLRVPIDGRVELALVESRVRRVSFDLSGKPGEVLLAGLYDEPLVVGETRIKGSVRDGLDRIHLDEARVGLGSSDLQIEMTARRDGDGFEGTLEGYLDQIPVDRLRVYWPERAAPKVRDWVLRNIPNGTAQDLRVDLSGALDGDGSSRFRLGEIAGSFRFDGLTVNALAPKPPISAVGGEATFTRERFDFDVTGGRLEEVVINRADLSFTGLGPGDPVMALDVECDSPVPTAIDLITGEPVDILDPSVLSSDDVAGAAATSLKLGIPLSKGSEKRIDYSVVAKLRQASWSQAPLDLKISEWDASLHADKSSLTIGGPARLNGVPASIEYEQRFDGEEPLRLAGLKARLDDDDRHALGLPDQPYVSGPASVELSYTEHQDGLRELTGEAELSESNLSIPELNWDKPAGRAGTARASAHSRDLPRVESIWNGIPWRSSAPSCGGSSTGRTKSRDASGGRRLAVIRSGSTAGGSISPRFSIRRRRQRQPLPQKTTRQSRSHPWRSRWTSRNCGSEKKPMWTSSRDERASTASPGTSCTPRLSRSPASKPCWTTVQEKTDTPST
jgi:hypothetical protein